MIYENYTTLSFVKLTISYILWNLWQIIVPSHINDLFFLSENTQTKAKTNPVCQEQSNQSVNSVALPQFSSTSPSGLPETINTKYAQTGSLHILSHARKRVHLNDVNNKHTHINTNRQICTPTQTLSLTYETLQVSWWQLDCRKGYGCTSHLQLSEMSDWLHCFHYCSLKKCKGAEKSCIV